MTFSVPSFLQAATRPLRPPKAAAEVAVAAFVLLPELPEPLELALFDFLQSRLHAGRQVARSGNRGARAGGGA